MLINYCFGDTPMAQALYMDPVHIYDYYPHPQTVIKCPATQYYAKNFYVIPFPIDWEFKFKIHHGYVDYEYMNLAKDVHERLIRIRGKREEEREDLKNNSLHDMQVNGIDYLFWADENVHMETWGADFLNLIKLPASFDIKKWIRQVHSAYLIPDDKEIHVKFKRGDPYMFVRFNTDKKVKLKYNNDALLRKEAMKMGNTTNFNLSGFKKFFDRFEKIRPKKLTK